MSISMFPDQVDALHTLVDEIDAFGIEVAPSEHLGLRVVAFARDESQADPVIARWFTVSVAGTVREIAPDPDPVLS